MFTALGWRAEVTKVKKSTLEAKDAEKNAPAPAKAENADAAKDAVKADAAEPAANAEAPAPAEAEVTQAPVEAKAEEAAKELVEVKFFVRVDRRKRGGAGAGRGQRGPRQDARGGKGAPKGKGGNRPNRGGGNGDRSGKPGGRNPAPVKENKINEDSPFAKLKEMLEAKG